MKELMKVFSFAPTLDTVAYTANDRLGSINTISNFFRDTGAACQLLSINVIDQAKQKAAMDILFFNQLPTVASADNAALDISDAEMAAKCIGRVSIATGDYATDLANNSEATKTNIFLILTGAAGTATAPIASRNLYVVLRTLGSPTYVANSLTIRLGVIG